MKILVIQNRMGIGDTVIFLPYIKALSKKFNSPISLLVKESSKADQFLFQTNYIDKIILLERDKKIELLSNQIDIYKKENDERIKANDLSNEIISSWDESVDNETNKTLKNAVDFCKKEKKYSFIWYYNKCETKKID